MESVKLGKMNEIMELDILSFNPLHTIISLFVKWKYSHSYLHFSSVEDLVQNLEHLR